MRAPRRPLLLLALLLTLIGARAPARAGEEGLPEALDGLSGRRMLTLVEELAAPAMQGRRTGFAGGQAVEDWIVARFSEFGLHPADAAGTYLEPFTFQASRVTAPIALRLGGTPLVYGKDFRDLLQTGGGRARAEVVFCGYGISRPELGWDDYAGVDVKGRIVLALRGVPAARADELAGERFLGAKVAAAADRGAAGLLLVDGDEAQGGTILPRFARPHLPALWISAAVADRIVAGDGRTIETLRAERDGGSPGRSFGTGAQVELSVQVEWKADARGHNALGAIRGRDPDLKDEIVIVGAHVDHLGVGPDGSLFPGADDNASGTALLVHLADLLTTNRWRPKRTVVFCGFGAEEQGLLGSQALAARYPFPGRVVCVLNVDMVGQGEPVVAVSGGDSYPAMQARLDAVLPDGLRAATRFGGRAGPWGDHWPFGERGVPAFFVSTKGPHANYHSAQDVAANGKPECLEAAARTVGALLVGLGEWPEPLADDLALPTWLLNEGPRFARASLAEDGVLVPGPPGAQPVPLRGEALAGLRSAGVSALLVRVPEPEDPRRAWQRLEALEQGEGSPWRLARSAADVGRAWQEGRLALVPVLACASLVAADAGRVADLASIGYRVLAPFPTGDGAPAPAAALLAALRAAPVAVDATGLSTAHAPALREGLGDAPVLWAAADPARPLPAGSLGPATLRLVEAADVSSVAGALGAPEGSAPGVLLGAGEGDLAAVLAAWAAGQPAGWDLPDGETRRALRSVLGGRLVAWLRRAER